VRLSGAASLGLVAFFTVVFTVFYAVSYSVLSQVVANYRRYYQKADLQWTGPAAQPRRRSFRRLGLTALLGLMTAWLVVQFVILS